MKRNGAIGLVMVMLLALTSFVAVLAQLETTHSAADNAGRLMAGEHARAAVNDMLESAREQLASAAADPASPSFMDLRGRLLETGRAVVDVSDLVHVPPARPALAWSRPGAPAERPVGALVVEPLSARVIALSPLPDRAGDTTGRPPLGSPDERHALLELRAAASVTMGGHTVRRALTVTHELKVVVTGPPRPFDQVGLYAGRLSQLTDAVRANRIRDEILALLGEVESELHDAPVGLTPGVRARIAHILAGLPPSTERENSAPRLPDEESAVIGLSGTGSPDIAARELDLAAGLGEDLSRVREDRAKCREARAASFQDGGDRYLTAIMAMMQSLNSALLRSWRYQRELKLVRRSSPDFAHLLASYEERLEPAWFRSRIVAELQTDRGLFADWTAGRRALVGVFRVRANSPVRLTGTLAGRAVLLVDAPGITLRLLEPGRSGDLITIICPRGRVRVEGRVTAEVVCGPEATLELADGAVLLGGLALAPGARIAEPSGTLSRSPSAENGRSIEQALRAPGRGIYGVCISPAPIYSTGDHQ